MNREKLQKLVVLLKKHIKGVYVWGMIAICATLVVFSLFSRLMQTGELAARLAYERGQMVIYHVAAGEVDGTPRHTKREAVTPEGPKEPIVGQGGAVIEETFAGHEGLAPAPLDAITEQTDKGLIPTAGRDGTLPWKYYAKPYNPTQPRPMVAILFTNLGLSRPLTEEVMKLPHTVTLSFSPYASDAKNWAKKARAAGFESLIDLPMEPSNFPISDPGPYGILSDLDSNEISSRTHWIMSRYPGFVGLLGTPNEKLTVNLTVMRSLLTELTARGVVLLYMKTPQNAELGNMIKTQNMLGVGVDAVIDDELTPAAVTLQLDALAEKAKLDGHAIGIAHSYPPTLRALSAWMEELDKKGIDVVPVSAIAKKVLP